MARKRSKSSTKQPVLCDSCKKVIQKKSKDSLKNRALSSLDGLSDVSDRLAAEGFVNDHGETLYIVEDVLKYSSDGKFLVKWQGYPVAEASWLDRKDMPNHPDVREKMKKLQRLYNALVRAGSN